MFDKIDMYVANYHNDGGSLHIKHEHNKFFWGIGDDSYNEEKWEWQEIPEYLYDALVKYSNA